MSTDDQESRQHRRPRRWRAPSLSSVVTAAVVAYGTYRLVSWAWNNLSDHRREEEENDDFTEVYSRSTRRENATQRRDSLRSDFHNDPSVHSYRLRRQRMDRCRGETIKAMDDFLPTLRRAIEAATDTIAETQELKRLREERRVSISNSEGAENGSLQLQPELKDRETELWDVIKEQSVTRAIATAYAHTILFLVLTVQVNLLGGRLLEEQVSNKSSSSSRNSADSGASDRLESYQASHRMVLLKTYEFFFDRGVVALVQTVRRAVSAVLSDISVSDPSSLHMTRETFERIISDIRNVLEGRGPSSPGQSRSRRNRPLSLLRFLLPPEAGLEATIPDELARTILDETWDLLESPVLEDAQRDCLGVTFELMRDHGWGNIFAADAYDESQTRWTSKPLANVVIQLKNTSKSFFEQGLSGGEFSVFGPRSVVNAYLGAMEMLPSVLELADVSFG